jgi:hypothetical protein
MVHGVRTQPAWPVLAKSTLKLLVRKLADIWLWPENEAESVRSTDLGFIPVLREYNRQ